MREDLVSELFVKEWKRGRERETKRKREGEKEKDRKKEKGGGNPLRIRRKECEIM